MTEKLTIAISEYEEEFQIELTLPIPVIPTIDAAIEDAINAGGILEMSTWHGPGAIWCGTVHCRAGWAVHLAGEEGKALQDCFQDCFELGDAGSAEQAGNLIYLASRPGQDAPPFLTSEATAWADIQKCAAEQREAKP